MAKKYQSRFPVKGGYIRIGPDELEPRQIEPRPASKWVLGGYSERAKEQIQVVKDMLGMATKPNGTPETPRDGGSQRIVGATKKARDQLILAALQTGKTHKQVAREFGLTSSGIGLIARQNGLYRYKTTASTGAGSSQG